MSRTKLGVILCVFGGAAVATANPIFLGTQGNTLFRIDGGVVSTFTLSTDLTSMAVDANGTIWASALTDADGDGSRELYILNDPLGAAPALTLQSDFLSENTASLTFIGNTLYGIQKTPLTPPSNTRLVTIDPFGQTQSFVGATGQTGFGANGTGYDPLNDKLYSIISGSVPGTLSEINYSLSGGAVDPDATAIGPFGINFVNAGAEFYDGTFYGLVQKNTDPVGELVLGSIDTSSGAFTEIMLVDNGPSGGAVGLVVLPEPGTALLLVVSSLVVLRRRRQNETTRVA